MPAKKTIVSKKGTAASKSKTAAKRTPADRRRLLNEEEFKRLIETGQVVESDRRSWMDRRKAETARGKKKKA